MSARASGRVWEFSNHKGSELLVLLAIADQAKDDGRDAWPSVSTLARKTRLSVRAVRYIIRKLQESGELTVEESASPKGTNLYHVRVGDAKFAGEARPAGVQNGVDQGCNPEQEGVQDPTDPPAIAVAPEPSLNRPLTVQEPSNARAREKLSSPFLFGGKHLGHARQHGFSVSAAYRLIAAILAEGVLPDDCERIWWERIKAGPPPAPPAVEGHARDPPEAAAE